MYKNVSDWFVTQDHNWNPHAMEPFWRCHGAVQDLRNAYRTKRTDVLYQKKCTMSR